MNRDRQLDSELHTHLEQSVRDHMDRPFDLALALDNELEDRCAPWYRFQVVADRDRHVAVKAAIEGRAQSGPGDLDNPVMQMVRAFALAAQYDADVVRAFTEVFSCLTHPAAVLGRPGMMEKVLEASAGRTPRPTPGPTREELLELVA